MGTSDFAKQMSGYIRQVSGNRHFWIAALSAGIVFLFSASFANFYIAHAQPSVPAFTLRLEDRLFSAGHEGELIDVKTVARRSDGTSVQISHALGQVGFRAGVNIRRIVLPSGQLVMAYDNIRGVTRWNHMSAAELARHRAQLFNPPNGCVNPGEKSLSKESIMGHETVALLWPSIGNQKVTEWRALDLKCETIQGRIEERQPDGSYKIHNEISAVSLVMGEPDATLFDIPQDYTNLKPSEFLHRELDKMGVPWTPEAEAQAQRNDSLYLGHFPTGSGK